jgi:prolyl-tRNA synthetase
MLSFGRNNTDGSDALDELQLAFKKSSALKNAPKVGEKAFAYFNEKLCAALVKKLSQYKNFLKQEYAESAEVAQATALTEEAVAEVEDEETVQLVLECSKCGGIKVVVEADVKVDEETDLANVGDPCQYCEEVEGYKIIGSLAPYDVAEEPAEEITDDEDAEVEVVEDEVVEEGLLDVDLPISVDVRADGNNVTVGGIS